MKIDRFLETSKGHFDLDRLDREALEHLKNTFITLEYTEKKIYETLEIPHLGIASLSYMPILLDFKLAENTPFNKLAKLFLFSQDLPREELLKDLFGEKDLEAYLRMGILEKKEDLIRSSIGFYPCLGYYIATDRNYPDYRFPNAVMYLGQDSYTLARATMRKPVKRTLDICSGSGVHAILAAAHSDEVIGVDINGRAINFSRFNSIFNDVKNVRFMQGDLFEPVRGEKFDLILANPPFVPAPEVKIYFRDGGKTGEDPLGRILGNLHGYLTDDGVCQIFSLLVFQKGQDYLQKLYRYLGKEHFNILVLATNSIDIEFFVIDQMSGFSTFAEYRGKLVEWLKSYYDNKINKLADGIIIVSRTREDAAPASRMMKYRVLNRPFSDEIERYFEMLYDYEKDASLASQIPALRENVKGIWKECFKGSAESYVVTFQDDDLSHQVEISADEFGIVALCDGRKDVAELATLYAGAQTDDGEMEHLKQKCFMLVRELAKKFIIEFLDKERQSSRISP
jgi:methylase of polypeptide subunit release factors